MLVSFGVLAVPLSESPARGGSDSAIFRAQLQAVQHRLFFLL